MTRDRTCHSSWEALLAFGIGFGLAGTATYVIVRCPPGPDAEPSTTTAGVVTGIVTGVATSAVTAVLVSFLLKGYHH